ncbi:TolB family protein [Kangiella sp.]|uniref:TolB family protein n=1 Tax=Kangiella sp. TaxID=1920245 RepID=UPI003A8F18DC
MNFSSWLAIVLSAQLVCVSDLRAEDETPAIPSTDIVVIPVSSPGASMKVDAGNALNAFNHIGYDNQPHFSADGELLYFTRMMDEQTDIFAYHFAEKKLTNVTQSDDVSEYSPTVYDDSRLSVIGVNSEGQQHLRLITLDDATQQVLNPAIEPVGYHAWLNSDLAATFVLGEVMTLQLLDVNAEGKAEPLVENIGRCLQRVTENKVSFTQLIDGQNHIFLIDQSGDVKATDIVLPEGVQDYVWLDSNGVAVGKGSQLWYISNTEKKILADLKELEINNISRLALDTINQRLALVYK